MEDGDCQNGAEVHSGAVAQASACCGVTVGGPTACR
jgi:hypothetical protein